MARPRIRVLAGALVLAAAASPALATSHVYLDLEGQNVGAIEGEVTDPVYQDQIEVSEFHHLLSDPGAKTVQHEQVVFTMQIVRGAPLLFQAWDTADVLSKCIFTFLRPGAPEEEFFSVTLSGARVAAIEPITKALDPLDTDYRDLLRVRIIYDQMTVESPQGSGPVMLDNPTYP